MSVCLSVCLCVRHTGDPCKNGWTDRVAVEGRRTLIVSRKHMLNGGIYGTHLANIIEQFYRSAVIRAVASVTLATCFIFNLDGGWPLAADTRNDLKFFETFCVLYSDRPILQKSYWVLVTKFCYWFTDYFFKGWSLWLKIELKILKIDKQLAISQEIPSQHHADGI